MPNETENIVTDAPTARSYRTVDKSTWGRGPWQDEPDKMQWTDPATGLPCLILRNRGGALCGYVGVAASHPFFEKGYSECLVDNCTYDWHYECTPEGTLQVHGGITYADSCQAGAEEHSICHVPAPGQPDHVWWFGFDCAHSGDASPAYRGLGLSILDGGTYRDVEYVRGQIAHLAEQLAGRHAP